MIYYILLWLTWHCTLRNDFIITGYSAFFIPFLFHGFYDFLLNFQGKLIYFIFIIYVIIMYAFAIFLLIRLSKFDIVKLKNKRIKQSAPTFKVQQQVHKNIYYNNIYNNVGDSLKVDSNKPENNNGVKSNWKNAESNEIIYENDKVEMNMFRNDK